MAEGKHTATKPETPRTWCSLPRALPDQAEILTVFPPPCHLLFCSLFLPLCPPRRWEGSSGGQSTHFLPGISGGRCLLRPHEPGAHVSSYRRGASAVAGSVSRDCPRSCLGLLGLCWHLPLSGWPRHGCGHGSALTGSFLRPQHHVVLP